MSGTSAGANRHEIEHITAAEIRDVSSLRASSPRLEISLMLEPSAGATSKVQFRRALALPSSSTKLRMNALP